MKLLLCAALAMVACGKDKPKRSELSDDEKARLASDLVKTDVEKIRAALTSPKPDDARYPCAAALAVVADLKKVESHAALAKEIDDSCNHDIHVAILRVETEKAEAARKAKPDDKVLSACYDAYYELAVTSLAKAGRADDTSKALEARFAAVCPNAKK